MTDPSLHNDEYDSVHTVPKYYPRTTNTQIQIDLEVSDSDTDPSLCSSHLLIEITSTRLPTPFANSTRKTAHSRDQLMSIQRQADNSKGGEGFN